MRKLIVSTVVAASLALGATAIAATTAPSAPAGKMATATAPAKKPAAPATPVDPKTLACEKQWKAEKTHKQSEKAYVKTCLAKDSAPATPAAK